MKTLQEILHARASSRESRAANAVIDVQGSRVRILMADVGGHARVVLNVVGNDVTILAPTDLYKTPNEQADAAADEARRHMTSDNVAPGTNLAPNAFALAAAMNEIGQVQAVVRDGKIFAGEDGPEILPPPGWGSEHIVDTQAGQPIERPTSAGGAPDNLATGDGGNATKDDDETLLGSSLLPSNVEIAAGKEVQLGAVVARSHKDSGLSVADWNALPNDDREAKLAATVEAMKTEASAPEQVDHTKFSKDELIELAEKEKVEGVSASTTKAEIAAAINAKRGIPATT